MNSIMPKVKSLIDQNNFMQAIHVLESQKVHTIEIFKLLSLLYRFLGQIEKEENLLKSSIVDLNSDKYLRNRLAWCRKPMFEKLVPRKVITANSISSEFLNQIQTTKLFFVTAGNNKYYDILIECVLSFLACNTFSHCPICIIDCGLNKSNIFKLENLNKRIKVMDVIQILKSHNIELPFNEIYLAGLIGRGFFNVLFPNADFCFYLDADAWIQDESGIIDYLRLAMDQDIALPLHPFNTKVSENHHWLRRGTLTESQIKSVIGFPAIINCCFCAKLNSKVYNSYCNTLRQNVAELGMKWGVDQEVLLFTAATHKLTLLPVEYAYEGPFKINIDKLGVQTLYSKGNNMVKVVHLGGGIKKQDRKWIYFHELEQVNEENGTDTIWSSIHFKVPEWINNDILIQEMKKLLIKIQPL